MDISLTSHGAQATCDATAERKRNVVLSSVAGGLSAWFGGAAFCIARRAVTSQFSIGSA